MADTPKDAARPMTAAETLTLHEIATAAPLPDAGETLNLWAVAQRIADQTHSAKECRGGDEHDCGLFHFAKRALHEAVDAALAAPPPDAIACPACGDTVRQVSSATLGLALFQHWNWACRRTPPAAPEP